VNPNGTIASFHHGGECQVSPFYNEKGDHGSDGSVKTSNSHEQMRSITCCQAIGFARTLGTPALSQKATRSDACP